MPFRIGPQGSGGSSFSPSQNNLYAAVKAILHPETNAGVTADDADKELDIAGGGGGASTFAALTDTPNSLTRGEYVRVAANNDRLEFFDLGRDVGGTQQALGLYGQFLRGLGLSEVRTFRNIALDDQSWFRMEVRTDPDPSGLSHNDFGIANFGLHDRASYVAIEVPRGWLPDAVQVRRAANGNTDYPGDGQRWLKIDVTGGHAYADYYWLVDDDGDPVDLRTAVVGATAFMRIGSITLAPLVVKYWRDNTETPSVPSDAEEIGIWPGRGLYDVEFGGPASNRRIHFALPEAYALDTVAVESRNRLDSFASRTAGGERIYDSGQLASGLDDLEMLIRASHA